MTRRMLAIVAAVAFTTGLAACGEDESIPTGSGTASGATAADYGVAVEYVGGTEGAADDSEEPITIGWVNEEGGATSSPEATAGLQAAVSLVNERLGGVGGHPLEVVTCFVASSEEEGQQCAQQMYNNQDVQVVLSGPTSLAAGPLHNTLADSKPILGSFPSSPSDLTAKNAYYINAGPFGVTGLATYVIQELQAKQVAVVAPDFIGTTIALQGIRGVTDPAGVKVTPGLYKQGAADVTPAVLASEARSADAVLVLDPDGAGCAAVSKALTQYSITAPVVSISSCAEDSVAETLGDLPAWTYGLPTLVPSMSVSDPSDETAVFLAAMEAYQPDSTVFGLAGISFSQLLYAVRLMNELGLEAVTPDAFSSAVAGSTGPVFQSVPTLRFGVDPEPTVGSSAVRFHGYEGDGRWTAAADGEWFS